jgi:hypothetical protein
MTQQTYSVLEETVKNLPSNKNEIPTGGVPTSSWFINTWADTNKENAVKLFPYKLHWVDENNAITNTFALPISPQQLTITTPFAVMVTPTLNGLVEEHNSVRFKDIEIAGTMGVFPADRDREFSKALLLRAFDPTGLADSIDSIAGSVPLVNILTSMAWSKVEPTANSGYANLHKLRIFLESYAEKKKSDKKLRLVFASYKDNQFYYVTPVSFVVRRSASNPMEYEYSLGLRAWGSYDVTAQAKFNPTGAHLSLAGALAGVAAFAALLPSTINTIGRSTGFDAGFRAGLTTTTRRIASNISGIFGNPSGQLVLSAGRSTGLIEPNTITQAAQAITQDSTSAAQSLGLAPPISGVPDPRTGSLLLDQAGVPIQQSDPTYSQMNTLFILNEMKILLDHAQASLMMSAPQQASPLDYVAGLASQSGVAFTKSVSKYPVSMPANATLEHLSAKYLGDPNRWMEIATLNGLQQPYVDNAGTDAALLFDGAKNKIVIRNDSVGIGKYLSVASATVPRKTYGVLSVVENGYFYEITLDNNPDALLPNSSTEKDDLSRYTVADKATIRYYKPNTVRAGQILYIPSNEASDINEFNVSQIPSLKQYEQEIRVSGVDLLLNTPSEDKLARFPNTLDLVIENNDVALSYGITNLKQALYLILFTPKGSILQHPSFGVPSALGESNADLNYDSFAETIKAAVLNDKSFSDVEFVTTSLNGPVLTINLGVRIAQLNKVLPIAFDVNLRGV